MKKTFYRIKNLIIDSKREWYVIDNEVISRKKQFKEFVTPFAILCSVIVFIGQIIEDDFFTSFKYFSASFITILLSIYCSFLILKEITNSNKSIEERDCENMVIYSSAVFFVFHSFAYLFNDDSIIRSLLTIAQFVCIITIWNGVGTIIKVNRSNKTGYTAIIALLITVIPSIIEQLLYIILNIQIASI